MPTLDRTLRGRHSESSYSNLGETTFTQNTCSDAVRATTSSLFGGAIASLAEYPIVLDNVECLGNETSLLQCRHNGWRQTDCDGTETAGVVCQTVNSPDGMQQGRHMLQRPRTHISTSPLQSAAATPPTCPAVRTRCRMAPCVSACTRGSGATASPIAAMEQMRNRTSAAVSSPTCRCCVRVAQRFTRRLIKYFTKHCALKYRMI